MRKLILFLLLPFSLSAQSLLHIFFDDIVYNGTELITNAIDRDFELASAIYTSNYSTNTNGWTALRGTATGNIDGIGGADDNLRYVVDNTSNDHPLLGIFITTVVGSEYRVSYNYYIPSTNSKVNGIRLLSGDGSYFTESTISNTINSWTSYWINVKAIATNGYRIYAYNNANLGFQDVGGDDPFYVRNVQVIKVSNYQSVGNHSADTTALIKHAGTYGIKLVASGAGNGTTNTISLASTLFTSVTNGTNYRFQVYAYTSTANTTLTFKLGDILLTKDVPTSGMNVLNFDFKATGSTTGNIYLYLNKAATVYVDDISFKKGE